MNNFLRKINLVEDYNFELPTSKTDFISKFRRNVENSNLGFDFFEGFEALSSSNYEYKGYINEREFEIKRKRKLFEPNQSFATAKGTYKEVNEKLQLAIEINAFSNIMYFFLGIVALFYLFFVSVILFGDNEIPSFVILFLFIHAAFMIGIPYFVMRRSINKIRYNLERDFYYWVTKNK